MKRRFVFSMLTLLFVAFFFWRIAWITYAPQTLRVAVPPEAVVVSEHVRLAERWPVLAAHPVVRSIALGLGVPAVEWDQIAADPGTLSVLQRLAARDTLTAYVPEYGRNGEPAWVLASWVGFEGQLLRWGFYRPLLTDFEACTFADGRRGWRYRDPAGDLGGRNLSFAVTEGVLLGCLSEEPDGVTRLVHRIERKAETILALRSEDFPEPADEPDRVLIGDLAGAPAWRESVGVWEGWLRMEANAQASGRVRGPAPQMPGLGGEAGGASVAGMARLLRDTPGALLLAPADLIGAAENITTIGPAVRTLWEHLQALAPSGGRMFLTVTQPEYGGRILGFKVATAMLGIEIEDTLPAEPVIRAALDAFNAEFNTTLIRRPVIGDGGVAMTTVESARSGPLSRLASGERPSYVITNGWLVVSSSGTALARMLSLPPGSTPAWARELASERGGAMAWVDLAAAADALTKITALQDLAAMAQGRRREMTPERQQLAMVQAWLEELSAMQRLRLWVDRFNGVDELQFQLGPQVSRGSTAEERP